MTRRHLRNIGRTDARRVRHFTWLTLTPWEREILDAQRDLDRRDYVWPDAVETPTSGTETGQDGDEGAERAPEGATGRERGSYEISFAILDIDIATAEALLDDMSRVAHSRRLDMARAMRPLGARDRDITQAVAHELGRCLAIVDEHIAKADRANFAQEAFRLSIMREAIANGSATCRGAWGEGVQR